MTMVLGRRCADGVALVADRRHGRMGGLEPAPPSCKLVTVRGLVMGCAGLTAVCREVERRMEGVEGVILEAGALAAVADVQGEVAKDYKEGFLKDDALLFLPWAGWGPDGRAWLGQVASEGPGDLVEWGAWGGGGVYGAALPWLVGEDRPVEAAWKLMVFLVAVGERLNRGIGDGVDVWLLRDGDQTVEKPCGVDELLSRSREVADVLPGRLLELLLA